MTDTPRPFAPLVQTVIDEFIPIIQRLAGDQPYAISVGGSLGKGTWDSRSDIDFRLFCERVPQQPERWAETNAAIERWGQQGVMIDGVWPRTIAEIDTALDAWLAGSAQPQPMVWTVWGYRILPDIYHQHTILDPYSIIAGWKERLRVYPPALKGAILKQNLASLRYWRQDYHYAHKVQRGDVVFLAGLTSKLVHEMIEILFALNETYFVGDGSNLAFAEKFHILPEDFAGRVARILYPHAPDTLETQYRDLCALVDQVIEMAE